MHAIGLTCLLAGFSGILAFGVLGASRSLPIALVTHGSLVALALVLWIKKTGSIALWWRQRIKADYFVHPSVVTAIGIFFGFGGVALIVFGNPSEGPDAMNRPAIVYFGILFLFLGIGVSSIAGMDWLEAKGRKPNH